MTAGQLLSIGGSGPILSADLAFIGGQSMSD